LADPSLNPYSVSTPPEDIDGGPVSTENSNHESGSFDPDLISSTGMVIDSIRMTTFAGATFGLLVPCVLYVFVGITRMRSGQMGGPMVSEVLAIGSIATMLGGFLAFCFSVMASLSLVGMTASARGPSRRWDSPTMRLVHVGTGFASGWLSTVMLGFFAQSAAESVAFGLIPAFYGAIVTSFLGERKIRRAERRQKILLGDEHPEASNLPLVLPREPAGHSPFSDPPGRT